MNFASSGAISTNMENEVVRMENELKIFKNEM